MTTIPAGATAINNEARANPDANSRGISGAEPIRRFAAENDEYRGSEQVGVDDPFHLRRAELQAVSHRRQSRHDGRAVVADSEHRKAAGDQNRREFAHHARVRRLCFRHQWLTSRCKDVERRSGGKVVPPFAFQLCRHGYAVVLSKSYAFRKASRSALIVSACVVGMPCGKPL
jgi:hypothetical protein